MSSRLDEGRKHVRALLALLGAFAFVYSVAARAAALSGDVDGEGGRERLARDHLGRGPWMPFAGLRESGHGIGGIPYTLRDMQIEKLTVVRSKEIP